VVGLVKEAQQQGLGILQIIQLVPYVLPEAMRFAVPGTMLFAVASVFGRMSAGNEITALKAAGITPLAVVWPALALAIVISFISVWLNDVAVSWGRDGVRRRDPRGISLELALDLERDDDAEERGAFDEGREDERRGLDLGRRLRLTGDALDGLRADVADAHRRADDGETRADAGADEGETVAVRGRRRGLLEKREERHVMHPLREVDPAWSCAPVGAVRHRVSRPNGLPPDTRRGTGSNGSCGVLLVVRLSDLADEDRREEGEDEGLQERHQQFQQVHEGHEDEGHDGPYACARDAFARIAEDEDQAHQREDDGVTGGDVGEKSDEQGEGLDDQARQLDGDEEDLDGGGHVGHPENVGPVVLVAAEVDDQEGDDGQHDGDRDVAHHVARAGEEGDEAPEAEGEDEEEEVVTPAKATNAAPKDLPWEDDEDEDEAPAPNAKLKAAKANYDLKVNTPKTSKAAKFDALFEDEE